MATTNTQWVLVDARPAIYAADVAMAATAHAQVTKRRFTAAAKPFGSSVTSPPG